MADPYNLSGVQSATNLATQLVALNALANNLISISVTIVVFCIMFIRFIDYGPKNSYAVSMLIAAIISIIFGLMGMMVFQIVLMFIILAGAGVIMQLIR